MLHFIHIFSTNISTEYFKHAAHSPFFSSKCHLLHNATFRLVHVLFTFYLQDVLKFKCKTPVPKRLILSLSCFSRVAREYFGGLSRDEHVSGLTCIAGTCVHCNAGL